MPAALVLAALAVAACGKRGDPRPPLRPIPGRVADLSAHRVDDRVELRFTVPAANLDGSTPAAATRVDVFAAPAAAAAPVPIAADIAADPRNLRRQVAIRPEETLETPAPNAPPDTRPRSGDAAALVERPLVTTPGETPPAFVHYVVRAVAGSGRGRPGPLSTVVTVPITALPPPPGDIKATHDETTMKLTWEAGGAGEAFRVYAVSASAGAAPSAPAEPPALLTPSPLTGAEYTMPVEFGQQRCFLVRRVQVAGTVTIDSVPAGPYCYTPVDTFPPPAPGGLQAVQEGTAVQLLWNPVDAPDLAGYLVLRREGAATVFQPLTPAAITAATFADATVRAGNTYVYAVVAVDKLGNLSPQSNWQTVTVR